MKGSTIGYISMISMIASIAIAQSTTIASFITTQFDDIIKQLEVFIK